MLGITRYRAYITLAVINHVLFALGMYITYTEKAYSWLVVSLIWYAVIKIIGVNTGLHRYFAHRSFKTSKSIERIITFFAVLSGVGTPIAYAAQHRFHHSPASGQYEGKTYLEFDPPANYNVYAWAKDLFKNTDQVFVNNYYLHILAVYALVLFLINPLLVVFLFSVPMCLCISPYAGGALHFFAHNKYGYQNFKLADGSKNSWLCNFLTLGEGWHNNHHANPHGWKLQVKWWELDPPAWIIRFIKK